MGIRNLGILYYQKSKNYEKALEYLESAIKLDFRDSNCHYFLGKIYLNGFKNY